MDAVQKTRKALDDKKREIYIYNPSGSDFTCQYNFDGEISDYTIHSRESEKFRKPVADHIAKHLADQICNTRQRANRDKVMEQIYV